VIAARVVRLPVRALDDAALEMKRRAALPATSRGGSARRSPSGTDRLRAATLTRIVNGSFGRPVDLALDLSWRKLPGSLPETVAQEDWP
jgi:hypothetical protein